MAARSQCEELQGMVQAALARPARLTQRNEKTGECGLAGQSPGRQLTSKGWLRASLSLSLSLSLWRRDGDSDGGSR